MKLAIVHDYIKEYGGAERVLEALHEIWPEAPIYTTVFLPGDAGPHKARVKPWPVVPSFLQKLPLKAKLISPLRLVAPFVIESFDFSDFDIVLVSATGAYIPNLIVTRPETIHLCYCHTPPRYLYGYPTARNWQKHFWGRAIGSIINHLLRPIDYAAAQRVDYFVANSKNTAQRIKKFYRRESEVIYPPVKTREVRLERRELREENADWRNKKSYFLAGGRLARAKRIDLAISACSEMKLPLKVFGRMFAGSDHELRKIAGPTVEFLGEVSDEEKDKLFANCRAFIFPAEEEDFGITPVEAQAAGKPVIALRSGGVIESVLEGKTGIFFDQPSVESLVSCLKKFETLEFNPQDCIKQASKFDQQHFKDQIKKFVLEKYEEYRKTNSAFSQRPDRR